MSIQWYNYKALNLTTPLNRNSRIEACDLEEFILSLQPGKALYHCYYDLEPRDTFTNYSGLLKPVFDTVHFDLDSKDDKGESAWRDTVKLSSYLTKLSCPHHVFFSGNKGFHVSVHSSALGITLGEKSEIETKIKQALLSLQKIFPTIDVGIWNANRKFRAFRSQHETTKLYKICLTASGPLDHSLTLSQIKFQAITPQDIKYPHPAKPTNTINIIDSIHDSNTIVSDSISKCGTSTDDIIQGETERIEKPEPFEKERKDRFDHIKLLDRGDNPIYESFEPVNASSGSGDSASAYIEDDDGFFDSQAGNSQHFLYKNFNDKKCVLSMLSGHLLPQFSRHTIGLCIIVELRQQGNPIHETLATMKTWGERTFKLEPQRIVDLERQVKDVYSKDITSNKLYQFGCYGPLKQAYCSAKCKIYNNLDSSKRAETIDTNKTQKLENEARRNPDTKLSEGELADVIIKTFPDLCKSNGMYFKWNATHWERIDGNMFEDLLIKAAIKIYGNKQPIKKVKSLAEHIVSKLPVAPETNYFFSSCPNKFNFTDCTAEVISVKGKLEIKTAPHNKYDYLAYCAPFPLNAKHNLPKGTAFSKYMDVRRSDIGDDGVKILYQMLGAALIPYVPRIFFIEGETNSGKSTLAKLIYNLLGKDVNVSAVLPIDSGWGASRFQWEPSIGKIANIVLELPKTNSLDVNTLKMVRDKLPVDQDRKNKSHVKATLPFLHIYCCNKMPASLEGNSGALNNRITMLDFKQVELNGLAGIVELADYIWETDAGSVLEAAREGLADLVASNFVYFEHETSVEAKQGWQKMTDIIGAYSDDVKSGEWAGPKIDLEKYELGKLVYDDFKLWCADSERRVISKQSFYKELERRFKLPRQKRGKQGERFLFKSFLKLRPEEDCDPQQDALSY